MTDEQFERLMKVLYNIAGSLTIMAVVSIPIMIWILVICHRLEHLG